MSKVVTVQDYLIAKDPDKYKAMFAEKERLAGETVEALITERDERIEELETTIKELVEENEDLQIEINEQQKTANGIIKEHQNKIKELKEKEKK